MTPPFRSLPSDARRSLFIYNLFFPLVFLAMLPGFLLRMFRRGGFREKFGQRLGRYDANDLARLKAREWIWIHSISVGETFVALKLARAMQVLNPDIGVLLSVTTSTGFAEARKAAGERFEVIYNPIDFAPITRRALESLRPRKLVFIEAVWPNLLAQAVQRGIPTAFIPRVSPRSERRFRRFRALTGPLFRLVDRICVGEPSDIDRWENLGAERAHITCTGSIKLDQAGAAPAREAEFRALLEPLGVGTQTRIIVAGSTWAPEEKILADLLPALRREIPDVFLIIVPRHVERSDDIVRQLAATGLRVVRRRSLPEPQPQQVDILLVDVTGELRDWYTCATAVFIGKSMPGVSEVGGQNPGEPAMLGKPIIFGPHMENFASVVAQFLEVDGANRVHTPAELEEILGEILTSPPPHLERAGRLRRLLAAHIGAAERTASCLLCHEA